VITTIKMPLKTAFMATFVAVGAGLPIAPANAFQIPDGAVSDLSGNPNVGASLTISDGIDPVATFAGPSSYSGTGDISVDLSFDEDVTGLDSSDLTATNASIVSVTGSGTDYTITLTPNGSGSIDVVLAALAATDAAGNGNAQTSLSANTGTTIVDGVAPVATFNAPASYTGTGDISVGLTFDEDVTGLEVSDLVPTNASVADVSGSGTDYTITLTPDGSGSIDLLLSADAVTDEAGNGNAETSVSSSLGTVIADAIGPVATLDAPSEYTDTSAVTVTVTFDEAVNGFGNAVDDVVVSNGTWTLVGGSDGDSTYQIEVAPDGSGALGFRIPERAEATLTAN